MKLSDIIIQRIHEEGPISFRDYMEMCLYHPGSGYYTSAGNKIGRDGDYYTSPTINPVFGAILGRQLVEMWNINCQKQFTVVEYGGGPAMLCRDILDYLKNIQDLYNALNYYIIEKSPVMRQSEKNHLPSKVNWADSIRDIPSITGCVLSNELIDNFPVHQVVMEDELMEVFVDYEDGFVERLW